MIAAVAIFVSEGLLGVVAAAAAAAATSAGIATAVGADYSAMTTHLYLMPRKNVWKNHPTYDVSESIGGPSALLKTKVVPIIKILSPHDFLTKSVPSQSPRNIYKGQRNKEPSCEGKLSVTVQPTQQSPITNIL